MTHTNTILTSGMIQKKIGRIAYEIYDNNVGEEEIILAGILDRGNIVAGKIRDALHKISPFRIELIELELNKLQPSTVKVSPKMDFSGKVIILVDDVANSGRTLLYAMKPFLEFLPKKVQTAVLVDRMHKAFPVSVDYVGYSLSTTLQDDIRVDIEGDEIVSAYLI